MSEDEYRERMLKALENIEKAIQDLNENVYRIAKQYP